MEQSIQEELEFYTEWLELDKYHFKILTMITVLADNKRAFRGKLSDFCKNLSIQATSVNLRKIETTLFVLAESGYINILIDKDIYTISLTKSAEKDKNIVKIKREWYKLIRAAGAESAASWESVLKVFIYLLGLPQGKDNYVTYQQIGSVLHCSKSTVQRAVKTICNIDFKDFRFMKDVIKIRNSKDGSYQTVGTVYTQGIFFE
ncbi:MAG: hypothetical protein LUI12_07205 [Clostridiales bacterium]|nr:hypothetical protein [Clostridiales bacterium]